MRWKRLLLATLVCAGAVCAALPAAAQVDQPVNDMTPYDTYADPDDFLNGAMLELKTTGDVGVFVKRELENMKYCYNINTINLYGLEGFDSGDKTTNKDLLFDELKRLGMKAVVRIEAYNAASFAFLESDLDYVFGTYDKLIAYVSQESRRDQVAYFSLNMPVDDPAVQGHLEGGINGAQSKERQVSYATAFVKGMREKTWPGAKQYLSIFYGWDNTFETPSYAAAEADGYFINNYSYPVYKNQLPTADATGEELINANRLSRSMSKFVAQYPGKPLIVECGFHTLEYNDGVVPNQTAGLVRDKACKVKAMKATVEYYRTNYPDNFAGMLYFGYNLYKQEGNPPAVMDWSLVYPARGEMEAETAYRLGGAAAFEEEGAGGGVAVRLSGQGDGLGFYECETISQFKIRYKASGAVRLGVYVNDEQKQVLDLPASDAYRDIVFSVTVAKGAALTLKLEQDGEAVIDSVGAYPQLEAENGALAGGAAIVQDEEASSGAAVAGIASPDDTLTMRNIRGGARLLIRYKADGDSRIQIRINDKEPLTLELPACEEYTDRSLSINVPAGSDLTVSGISAGNLVIDYFSLSGVPDYEPTTEAVTTAGQEAQDGLRAEIVVAIALGVFLLLLAGFTVIMVSRNKKPRR